VSTKDKVLKGINYMKWGYTNYIALFLGIFNTILLVKGFFFSSVSLWIILPVVLIPFGLTTLNIGRWDFKKGLYPSASAISIRNSPPSRDLYKAVTILLINLIDEGVIPDTDENKRIIDNMRRWYE